MSIKTSNTFEYWIVENTGWSNELSWFVIGPRYSNYAAASNAAFRIKERVINSKMLWRITKVITTLEHEEI